MVIGGGCLTVIGLAFGEAEQLPVQLTAGAIGSFLYLLIVGSLIGFLSFHWLLGHVSTSRVSTYAYVNPIVAVTVGWVAGEEVNRYLGAGIMIILTGVLLVRAGGVSRHHARGASESFGIRGATAAEVCGSKDEA
jgi:drug/metabolite transporter (DMT)-like permease